MTNRGGFEKKLTRNLIAREFTLEILRNELSEAAASDLLTVNLKLTTLFHQIPPSQKC